MAMLANRDREDRPWGHFDRFTLNELSTVKVINIMPRERLSLQTHQKRSEFWRILSGSGEVTIGDIRYPAHPGDEFEIPTGVAHRVAAGDEGILFLEIALGIFVEHDEVRIEDLYGRTSPSE